jgi:L-lysine exporter family protein LysE/ArgO
MNTFLEGLFLGGGLILAIGPQSAHVLRMGLRREHVGITVAICIVVDMVLIGLGVAGMGAMVQSSPFLLALARWGGVGFLAWYGLRSLRAVLDPGALQAAAAAPGRTRAAAALAVLGLSLLNPQIYLDTVVLVGSIGGAHPADARPWFAAGAMTASVLWFGSIGFGAARLAHVLARPFAWKCIDGMNGLLMWSVAWRVATG